MYKIIIFNTALVVLIAALENPIINVRDLDDRIATLPAPAYVVHYKKKVNFFAAQEICGYHGMTLATIETAKEQELLKRLMKKKVYGKRFDTYWIGATDLGTRFQWVWLTNGRQLNYTNWLGNQPDNRYGNERCASMERSGHWHDYPCGVGKYFICGNRCKQLNKAEKRSF